MKKILPILALLLLSLSCKTLSTSPMEVPINTQEPPPVIENTAATAPMEIPPADEGAAPTELPNSALVDFYDPTRDPAEDLRQAIPIAQREHKNIMLELGGDWCIWCKYMDNFYATHPDILQARAGNYVLVKVNVSQENDNAAFLSQYPEAAGYPHIYILDSSGNFLHSQDTADLEDGQISYVPEVFMAFLNEWSPK
jgi:thioredoxin-related protein